jgi:hypothetical protein
VKSLSKLESDKVKTSETDKALKDAAVKGKGKAGASQPPV